MSSALSITRAVNPSRAVYLDFPLGHTAGKAGDELLQQRIMTDTLGALERIEKPGTIETLDYQWSKDDDWKDHVMRPSGNESGQATDERIERHPDPQYQLPEDRVAAEAELARGGCPGCVWPEQGE